MKNHRRPSYLEVSETSRERAQSKIQDVQTHAKDRERQTSDLISLDAICELLAVGKRRSADSHSSVLVSRTTRFPNKIDPVQLFAVARRLVATTNYWGLPAKQSWMVGVGEAAEIITQGPLRFEQATAFLRDIVGSAVVEPGNAPGPILLGGFRFKSRLQTDGPWREFHDGLLTLPRWMVVAQSDRQLWLTINVVMNGRTEFDTLLNELAAQALALFGQHDRLPEPVTASVKIEPVTDSWRQNVEHALGAIRDGNLTKVTLARTMKLRSELPIAPEAVLRSLTANYPECYAFAFSRRGTCFVGASPEELVGLNGQSVASTCLAGSAPRGGSKSDDMKLSEWLLRNVKERREHEVVVDWVSERMGRLCSELHWNEVPYVLQLDNVQHLLTRFVGTRVNGCHVLDFVKALHPTPAVGGIPLESALEMIERLEDFDRGWYTGPVGWVDRNGNGEFAIAIRCALLQDNEAFLYAGDGIVTGSDPDKEDQETTMKFKPLLTALGAL